MSITSISTDRPFELRAALFVVFPRSGNTSIDIARVQRPPAGNRLSMPGAMALGVSSYLAGFLVFLTAVALFQGSWLSILPAIATALSLEIHER